MQNNNTNNAVLLVTESPEGAMVYVDGEFVGYVNQCGGTFAVYIDPRNPVFGFRTFMDAVGYIYNHEWSEGGANPYAPPHVGCAVCCLPGCAAEHHV